MKKYTKNLIWIILFLIEFLLICLVLNENIPYLLQIKDPKIIDSTNNVIVTGHDMEFKDRSIIKNTFIYTTILFLIYYSKKIFNIKLYLKSIQSKYSFLNRFLNNFLSDFFHFIGRIFLIITGSFVVIIYIYRWDYFWNWKELFTFIYFPLILFCIFLIFKEFEELSKQFT